MGQLAIKGHTTRGREVIELLEMLGGRNEMKLMGSCENKCYWFGANERMIVAVEPLTNWTVFSLEEYFEKYPYKIGDKVKNAIMNDYIGTIINIQWVSNENEISYGVKWNDVSKPTLWYFAKALQPYKEETMEERVYNKLEFDHEPCANKVELVMGDNWEIKVENGKTYVVKKKQEYPKNYVECAKILDCFDAAYIEGYKGGLLKNLQKLFICRDAYWKIAGEEMGLGEPWKPDWSSCEDKFCITIFKNKQTFDDTQYISQILAFPTEEMRDIFFYNFRDLINRVFGI